MYAVYEVLAQLAKLYRGVERSEMTRKQSPPHAFARGGLRLSAVTVVS